MHDRLSLLPRVDRVVAHASLDPLRRRLGVETVTRLARRAIDEARRRVREGAASPSMEDVVAAVVSAGDKTLSSRARRVINATGVVLHTNLGRAPLAREAALALGDSAAGYTSVEIDLSTGKRGARGAFAESALAELSEAEAALVVNNNAAAVLLMLSALAHGKGVAVSRGELIEIGGGFRVPDVMARSGARLVEVGTTNKTRLADFERALDAHPDIVALLNVHQGNFRQIGFVERPPVEQLAELAHRRGVLCLSDLGGGALIDLAPFGLTGEPTARACIRAGADLVCFSTDKVLGGPQGGALVGRADLVERARRDPLARALRLGRLPLVALEATLALYLEKRFDDIPALAAMRMPLEEVRSRAGAWRAALEGRGVACHVIEDAAAIGGGALAETPLPSACLALNVPNPDVIAERLRTRDPSVLARIQDDRLLLDARTVLPGEDDALLEAVVAVVRS